MSNIIQDYIDRQDPKEMLQHRIDVNREEIDYWLNSGADLELIYIKIRMLSAQNEQLIKQLKE